VAAKQNFMVNLEPNFCKNHTINFFKSGTSLPASSIAFCLQAEAPEFNENTAFRFYNFHIPLTSSRPPPRKELGRTVAMTAAAAATRALLLLPVKCLTAHAVAEGRGSGIRF
jgi:hypothetical protein